MGAGRQAEAVWAGSLQVLLPARAREGARGQDWKEGPLSVWCLMGTKVMVLAFSVSFNVSTRGITEASGCCY